MTKRTGRGTEPITTVLDALRADQWAENHPELPADQRDRIRRQVRDAFYTDTDAWRGQVISQARQALFQAAQGLNS